MKGIPMRARGGGGREPDLYVCLCNVYPRARMCVSPTAGPHSELCVGPGFEEEVQSGSVLPVGSCLGAK